MTSIERRESGGYIDLIVSHENGDPAMKMQFDGHVSYVHSPEQRERPHPLDGMVLTFDAEQLREIERWARTARILWRGDPDEGITALWCARCRTVVSIPALSGTYEPVCPQGGSDRGHHLIARTARLDPPEGEGE